MTPSPGHAPLLLFAMVPGLVTGQFSDPGFEGTGTWWTTCPWAGIVEIVADVPPLGGNHVLALEASDWAHAWCAGDGAVPFFFEEFFGYPNGTSVTVSFWAKRETPIQSGPVWYHLVFGRMTSVQTYTYDQNMPGSNVSMPATDDWAYYEHTCVVSGLLQPPEALAILIGAPTFGMTGRLLVDNLMIRADGTGALLNAAAFLDGPYDTNTLMMRADLNTAGLIPAAEPYSAVYGGSGGEQVAPSVLAVTGPDAIVDWVRLELRSDVTSSAPVALRHALIQRDGDIVDTDGMSPVAFPTGPGNYYVTLRHRNHLAVMSAAPLSFTGAPVNWDIRLPQTACAILPAPFTDDPRRTVGAVRTLWAGNAVLDDRVKYSGSNNDRDAVLTAIGGTVPTNAINGQYLPEDLNLDGEVKYAGSDNDRDVILQAIGGTVPTATRTQQLP